MLRWFRLIDISIHLSVSNYRAAIGTEQLGLSIRIGMSSQGHASCMRALSRDIIVSQRRFFSFLVVLSDGSTLFKSSDSLWFCYRSKKAIEAINWLYLRIKLRYFFAVQERKIFVNFTKTLSLDVNQTWFEILISHCLTTQCSTLSPNSAISFFNMLAEVDLIIVQADGNHLSGAHFLSFIWIFLHRLHHPGDVAVQLRPRFILNLYH